MKQRQILFPALLPLLLLISQTLEAQSVGIGTASPHPSAKLDVASQTGGILVPRMNSSQRNAIASPEKGLLVFDLDLNGFLFYNGRKWQLLSGNDAVSLHPESISQPVTESTNSFGYQVAASNRFAAIASFTGSGQTISKKGKVYVFEKQTNGNWLQQAILEDAQGGSDDWFGHGLDIDGDYLIVGAPGKKNLQNKILGAAFIFRYMAGNWVQETMLQRSMGNDYDRFGFDVAITAPENGIVRAVVGAPGVEVLGATDGGHVSVYKKQGGSWAMEANLTPSGLSSTAAAGFSVDAENNRVVFGAPFFDIGSAIDPGKLFVYKYNGSQWIQEYALAGDGTAHGLGYSVSIHNGRVAAGAPRFTSGNGLVMMFFEKEGSWQAFNLYMPHGYSEQDGMARFGMSVSLWNDLLLVGAPAGHLNHTSDYFTQPIEGKAFLFRTIAFADAEISTSLLQVYHSDMRKRYNRFGQSASIQFGNLFIGDSGYINPTGNAAGKIFVGFAE